MFDNFEHRGRVFKEAVEELRIGTSGLMNGKSDILNSSIRNPQSAIRN